MTIRILIPVILILSILSGCAATSGPVSTPTPTPEPITVVISPVVGESGRFILRTCAWGLPSTVLLTEEASYLSLSADADLTLWWGNPNADPIFNDPAVVAVPLGMESISIVVHPSNPLSTLNAQDLQDIYNAQVRDWAEISGKAAQGEIQVWAYPSAHPLRLVFDQALLPQKQLTPHVRLAPSPEAMLEAIQEDPAAIGYLPSSFPITGTRVKKIPLQPQPEGLQQPILGIVTAEPEGNLAALLRCLQTNFPTNN